MFYRYYLHRSNRFYQNLTPIKCLRTSYTNKPQKLNLLIKCTSLTGIAGGFIVKIALNKEAICHPKNTRLIGLQKTQNKDLSFEWKQFWLYLKPHLLNFILAIAVSCIDSGIVTELKSTLGSLCSGNIKYTNSSNCGKCD